MAPPKRRKRMAKANKKVESDVLESEEAMLTIQRLSRKYLHKSPDASANDRGVIELPDPSPPNHSPNTSDATSGESNKRKMFSLCHTRKAKPKRLSKPTPIKNKDTSRKVLNLRKECNLSLQPVMSPRVKVPRPRLGRSKFSETPATSSRKENSLFGFEDLRTPRGLSPVISEVDDFTMSELVSGSPHKSGLEQSVKEEARAYRVPSKKRRNKKAGFSESEVKNWVTEMNRQFDEVDKFELPVE